MTLIKKIILLLFVILSKNLFPQDLKAGEINVTHITGNQYKAAIVFYYETTTFSNRPSLLLNWGDGTVLDTIQWNSFTGGCGDSHTITKNFVKIHSYSGDGNYLISCVDSFRVNNIYNINNSNVEKLWLQYNLIINSSFPSNNSSQSLNCLVDEWTGNSWIYNSGAYDVDGDSLSYSVVSPQNLSNYSFPDNTINNLSGDFALPPTAIGNYAICMKIEEWKRIPNSSLRSYFGSSYRNILIDVSSLASVNENFNNNNFIIYPNPAQSQIRIKFELLETKNVSFEIRNVLGQMVKIIENRAFSTGKNKIEIDVSEFSKGIYFVQLQSTNKILSNKFVKE